MVFVFALADQYILPGLILSLTRFLSMYGELSIHDASGQ